MDAVAWACQALVGVAVALHFAFIGYLLCGGFIAWRLPRTAWAHIVTAAWALGITFVSWLECPLTIIERWARGQAGMAPLPQSGFIAHYITGVFYPAGAAGTVRIAVAALVAFSWAGFIVLHRRAGRARKAAAPAADRRPPTTTRPPRDGGGD